MTHKYVHTAREFVFVPAPWNCTYNCSPRRNYNIINNNRYIISFLQLLRASIGFRHILCTRFDTELIDQLNYFVNQTTRFKFNRTMMNNNYYRSTIILYLILCTVYGKNRYYSLFDEIQWIVNEYASRYIFYLRLYYTNLHWL